MKSLLSILVIVSLSLVFVDRVGAGEPCKQPCVKAVQTECVTGCCSRRMQRKASCALAVAALADKTGAKVCVQQRVRRGTTIVTRNTGAAAAPAPAQAPTPAPAANAASVIKPTSVIIGPRGRLWLKP